MTYALVDNVDGYEPRQAQGRAESPDVTALGGALTTSFQAGKPVGVEVPKDEVDKTEGRLHYVAKKRGVGAQILGYKTSKKANHVVIVFQGIERREYKPRAKKTSD